MNNAEKKQVEAFVADSASLVMSMLDATAKAYNVKRSCLVEMFNDTMQALEQWKAQED